MTDFWADTEYAAIKVRCAKDFAKQLRERPTKAEARLEDYLCMCRLKYRFQFRLGHYIYDFCFKKQRLIIELDGSHHSEEIQHLKDLEKQGFAETLGYKVLRFSNDEVWYDIKDVGKRIRQALKTDERRPKRRKRSPWPTVAG